MEPETLDAASLRILREASWRLSDAIAEVYLSSAYSEHERFANPNYCLVLSLADHLRAVRVMMEKATKADARRES